MPEGDTIYRTATQLRIVLQGQSIAAARWRDAELNGDSLTGCTMVAIEPRGKHLLIHLDNGGAIHSHMGMTGSWHIYELRESWRKPERQAALVLQTDESVVVCFNPKALELLSPDGLRRHPFLHNLGPDLLSPDFDAALAFERFRVHNAAPVGEAVMNQTIVCGIGNIYKSETLFLARVNPFVPVGDLADERVRQVIDIARRLMKRNRGGYPRRTRFGRDGSPMWVYGRNGQSCLKCGDSIQLRRQGELGRTTFWCGECQAAADSAQRHTPAQDGS